VAERTLHRHVLEPMLAIALCWPRAALVTALLLYDRDTSDDDRRALACSRELAARWHDRGWLPYRLGIPDMPIAPPPSDPRPAARDAPPAPGGAAKARPPPPRHPRTSSLGARAAWHARRRLGHTAHAYAAAPGECRPAAAPEDLRAMMPLRRAEFLRVRATFP